MSAETLLNDLLPGLPVVQQLARLEEKLAAGQTITTVALILEARTIPPDGVRLDAEHVVVLTGPDLEEQAAVLARVRATWASPVAVSIPDLSPSVLVLDLRAGATAIDLAVADGVVREVCGLGARGDGKSVTGAVTFLHVGVRHRARGGTGPFKVLVMTSTMTEHRARLCETLREPFWKGLWQASNGEHTWTATVGGVTLVHLELVGIEDQGGLDRARIPAHGLWLEEAAPAGAEVGSAGLSDEALLVSPTCEALIEACAGRWHFPRDRHGEVSRDLPEKDHPWSDLGDSLCYVVGGAKPWRGPRPRVGPHKARMGFDVLTYHHQPRRSIGSVSLRTPWPGTTEE